MMAVPRSDKMERAESQGAWQPCQVSNPALALSHVSSHFVPFDSAIFSALVICLSYETAATANVERVEHRGLRFYAFTE